ncbi:MAG: cytochrome c peroxidase [Planctomycetota bacterium]
MVIALLSSALAFAPSTYAQEQALSPTELAEAVGVNPAMMQFFGPLPENMDLADAPATPEQISLGKKLFFETKLSKDGSLSCNSCHGLDTFGVDNRQFSLGVDEQLGGRNAPTVLNAAGHKSQFWDGRAANVEEQAKGPILNPVEMAMDSAEQVVGMLANDADYPGLFAKAFPKSAESLSWDNLASAIGAFERQLVTPAPWDNFLQGDLNALTPLEQKGFKAFVDTGCFGCHNGPFMGGQIYMKLGLVNPWPNQNDPGREAITGNKAHHMVFKVPSLRNVAKTAPYFHDGSVNELKEAVKLMSHHQRGIDLTEEELTSIVAYLGALTGEQEQSAE